MTYKDNFKQFILVSYHSNKQNIAFMNTIGNKLNKYQQL